MNENPSFSHDRLSTTSAILVSFCLCSIGLVLVGCEDDHTIGGQVANAVGHDDKASTNLSGTWRGVSGTGGCETVVNLTDNNGSLSGSLRWAWGGVRNFSGSCSGNSVQWSFTDSDGVSDYWQMALSSDRKKLTGHANKSDGGGYSISLSR